MLEPFKFQFNDHPNTRARRLNEIADHIRQLNVDDVAGLADELDTIVTDLNGVLETLDEDLALKADEANPQFTGVIRIAGTQVVRARITGWEAPTGTAERDTFSTFTAATISNPPTQSQVQTIANHVQLLSRHVAALIADMRSHGLIGT